MDRIRDELAREPAILFATLFGSRVTSRARPDSDWDVAVFLDQSLDPRARLSVRLQLVSALEPAVRVDVVVLNDAPTLLAHRALQGRPLLVRDKVAWVRFFVRTLSQSGDERIVAQLHAQARRRRAQEGRFGRP